MVNQQKYDLRSNRNIERYSRELRKLYRAVILDVSNMAVTSNLTSGGFYFRNYPQLNAKVNLLLKELQGDVSSLIVNGINDQWDLGNQKHNELFEYVFGKSAEQIPYKYLNRYLDPNIQARKAFIGRTVEGLNLSDRIWKNNRQFKKELELSLEYAISRGQSATTTAIQISKYLNNPVKLRENIETRFGRERLLRAKDVESPGRGRYRSSFKNALRLARNEPNFAYERAQMLRRQQQDFIVGIEIMVSPNYNIENDKGGIVCLYLEGRYPKDFDFSQKWHVNCLCTALNVLKTRAELDRDTRRILIGKEPSKISTKRVIENSNKQYIEEIREMTTNWKTKPRWLPDES